MDRSVFRHIYSTLSQKKNDLVIETASNVILFSRPVAAQPSDRKKNCGLQPKDRQYAESR